MLNMAKILGFRTEEEIQEFWDTHDSAEYFEDMEDDEVQVTFKRDNGVLAIPLGENRLRSVREIALEEGVSSNLLLKNWIDEGIKRKLKDFIKDEFYLFRYLKKYAIFLDDSSPPKAYGVLALKSDFQDMIGPWLPVFLKAVLLPFKGLIIYDGILIPYPVSFGPGIRQDLKGR
jgi:hypothetical protein